MLRCPLALLRSSLALALGAALALSAPLAAEEREAALPQLALMGTVPIYWGESATFDELLAGEAELHWARTSLELDYRLVPLDYLSPEALAGQQFLLLAQPRGLTADENVALDNWVRAGGRLLLFADPQMTGESRFALGDRRRPQDTALLSPILAHWGLELRFDPAQDANWQMREFAGSPVPTRLSGTFATLGDAPTCTLSAADLVAQCSLGGGFALILADAALLDLADPAPESAPALSALLTRAFGDEAGQGGSARAEVVSSDNIARNQEYDGISGGLVNHHEQGSAPP
ncbi:ABC transporter [Aurantiacibacter xanthus]|uniref:ABC transporter n=1 Tax=Aurantiacibacter xanthus TaxID=1784712 RepID=A0A3A1P1L9_9SPHN|nr:ABC transporter [Aurantiacibacter xanthus]RIV83182.1 ABC transporter [Aurantiacibacter xanthus]